MVAGKPKEILGQWVALDVLGRIGWFDRVKLGLIDHEAKVTA